MRRTDAQNTVNTGASRQGGRQRSCDDFTLRQARDARTYQAWCETWAAECLRILKPGGHLLAFGGTRTYHRLASGIEDAGFEMRDAVFWLYGQGFPKSRNTCTCPDPATPGEKDKHGWTLCARCNGQIGLGTALKPACEPISVARKSPVGSVAANVTSYGTGALNIAGCRIEGAERFNPPAGNDGSSPASVAPVNVSGYEGETVAGRWPANVILDETTTAMLDEQTGELISGGTPASRGTSWFGAMKGGDAEGIGGSVGGASRFFYVAKASQAERNAGLEGFEERQTMHLPDAGWATNKNPYLVGGAAERRNHHPTVKPVALMRWLVRLVTPPGGLILDPFMGSGTTGIAAALEGFRFWGIEQDEDYCRLADARIAFWKEHGDEALTIVSTREAADRKRDEIAAAGQLGIWGDEALNHVEVAS